MYKGHRKETINPKFDNFQYMSPKQVILSQCIILYRQKFNISQREMAHICSLYGEPYKIVFAASEIANYENLKTIPTPPKFQILMNTLGIAANDF